MDVEWGEMRVGVWRICPHLRLWWLGAPGPMWPCAARTEGQSGTIKEQHNDCSPPLAAGFKEPLMGGRKRREGEVPPAFTMGARFRKTPVCMCVYEGGGGGGWK